MTDFGWFWEGCAPLPALKTGAALRMGRRAQEVIGVSDEGVLREFRGRPLGVALLFFCEPFAATTLPRFAHTESLIVDKKAPILRGRTVPAEMVSIPDAQAGPRARGK